MDSVATADKTSSGADPANNPPSPPQSPTPEKSEAVSRYEEMFACRYTPEDLVYQPYINKGMDPPPIVENYFIRRPRQNWNDNNRDRRSNQDRGYKRQYSDNDNYQSKRQFDNRSHHHEGGGGWGQQGRNQHEGHSSHQDWRKRDGQGQSDRHHDGRQDRRSDERQYGRSGSQDSRHQSQGGRYSSHPEHDEWT